MKWACLSLLMLSVFVPDVPAQNRPQPTIEFVTPRGPVRKRFMRITVRIRHAPAGPLLVRFVGLDTVRYARVDRAVRFFAKQAVEGSYTVSGIEFPWRIGKHTIEATLFNAATADRGDPLCTRQHEIEITKGPGVIQRKYDDARHALALRPMVLQRKWRTLEAIRRNASSTVAAVELRKLVEDWQIERILDFNRRVTTLLRLAEDFDDGGQPERALRCYHVCVDIYHREHKAVFAGVTGRALVYTDRPPTFQQRLARFSVRYGRMKDAVAWYDHSIAWLLASAKRPDHTPKRRASLLRSAAGLLRQSARAHMQLGLDATNWRLRMDRADAIDAQIGRRP